MLPVKSTLAHREDAGDERQEIRQQSYLLHAHVERASV